MWTGRSRELAWVLMLQLLHDSDPNHRLGGFSSWVDLDLIPSVNVREQFPPPLLPYPSHCIHTLPLPNVSTLGGSQDLWVKRGWCEACGDAERLESWQCQCSAERSPLITVSLVQEMQALVSELCFCLGTALGWRPGKGRMLLPG